MIDIIHKIRVVLYSTGFELDLQSLRKITRAANSTPLYVHCIRNPYARIFDSAIYDLRCAYSGVFDIMVFTASSQFLLNIILTESMSFYVNLFVI